MWKFEFDKRLFVKDTIGFLLIMASVRYQSYSIAIIGAILLGFYFK